MKNGKKIKKLVALGTGALMVGASLFGAMAAGLSDLPSPFVKADGSFDGFIVVGADAKTGDVLGAIDIATAFQARAVKKEVVSVEGTTTTEISAVNGYLFQTKSQPMTFEGVDAQLNSMIGTTILNKDRLKDILADKELIEEGKSKGIKYSQKVDFVGFTSPIDWKDFDEDEKTAEFGIDLDTGTAKIKYVVEFDKVVDFDAYEDNEVFELFGNKFYISPKTDVATEKEIYLVRQATDYTLKVGEKLNEDGVTVEFVGATEDGKATLKVNGVMKTVEKGKEVVAGSGVYLKDISVYTIPEKFAVATISIGSKEIMLPIDDTTPQKIEIDGDTNDYFTVLVDDDSNIKTITFEFDVGAYWKNELEKKYILAGEKVIDPVFGLELKFEKAVTD
ncbi:MAG: hypothetical protein QXR30_03060, partial [Candidatus Woesearchaeota archaeon]